MSRRWGWRRWGTVVAITVACASCFDPGARFSAEEWRDANAEQRGAMLHDLSNRVLREGMTVHEVAALLALPDPQPVSWSYDITPATDHEAGAPARLVLKGGSSYAGAAILFDARGSEVELPGEAPIFLEAAQAVVRDGGVELWCRNAPGDRARLAAPLAYAINHRWPAEASLEELRACGAPQFDTVTVVTDGVSYMSFEQHLYLRFDGDHLDSWSVFRD